MDKWYAYLRAVLTRLPSMTNRQLPDWTPEAWAKAQPAAPKPPDCKYRSWTAAKLTIQPKKPPADPGAGADAYRHPSNWVFQQAVRGPLWRNSRCLSEDEHGVDSAEAEGVVHRVAQRRLAPHVGHNVEAACGVGGLAVQGGWDVAAVER